MNTVPKPPSQKAELKARKPRRPIQPSVDDRTTLGNAWDRSQLSALQDFRAQLSNSKS